MEAFKTGSWRTRVASGVALAGLALGGAQAARIVYRALSDAWVAPLHLSPDNDKVVALRLEHARQQAERRKMESELTAIEEEIRSIDLSTERLTKLRVGYGGALSWAAGEQVQRRKVLESELASLERQSSVLDQLLEEQKAAVERAKQDLAAGLITSAQLDRAEVAVHQAELEVQANERGLARVRAELAGVRNRSAALNNATRESAMDRYADSDAPSPEVLHFDEPAIRLELELARLQAEKRAAESRRRAVKDSMAVMDELLADVQSRPLYRAMTQSTDLAFVPYAGLEEMRVGNGLFRCSLAIFGCEPVGEVKEIVPGEVVTQDPWGELARGQYVVLSVSDPTALHEKVLRVRPGLQTKAAPPRLSTAGN